MLLMRLLSEVVNMTMQATVLEVHRDHLLVLDHSTMQKVRVNTPNACQFRMGDLVCIRYSGLMTMSLPPQISASRITVLPRFGPHRHLCR